VASVRESDRLRHVSRVLSSLSLVIGHFGGLGSVARAAGRQLRQQGAIVLSLDEPDAVTQAEVANLFAADVYVGLDAGTGDRTVVHYYRVPGFESVGGRTLATSMSDALALSGLDVADPCGMRLPILRETRMPAVLCRFAPVRSSVDSAVAVGDAVAAAVRQWTERPAPRETSA
jgi:N-acetylmuramoyl-L-alanine amidase